MNFDIDWSEHDILKKKQREEERSQKLNDIENNFTDFTMKIESTNDRINNLSNYLESDFLKRGEMEVVTNNTQEEKEETSQAPDGDDFIDDEIVEVATDNEILGE